MVLAGGGKKAHGSCWSRVRPEPGPTDHSREQALPSRLRSGHLLRSARRRGRGRLGSLCLEGSAVSVSAGLEAPCRDPAAPWWLTCVGAQSMQPLPSLRKQASMRRWLRTAARLVKQSEELMFYAVPRVAVGGNAAQRSLCRDLARGFDGAASSICKHESFRSFFRCLRGQAQYRRGAYQSNLPDMPTHA